MKISKIKSLIRRSKELYPRSAHMQRIWVKQTMELVSSGRHALMTGGWRYPE